MVQNPVVHGIHRRNTLQQRSNETIRNRQKGRSLPQRRWQAHELRFGHRPESYFVEDYVDFGEYLVNKGWAKRVEVPPQDTISEIPCIVSWYKIKLKGRNPIWMGILNDSGSTLGFQRIRFDYEKPTENDFWCREPEDE